MNADRGKETFTEEEIQALRDQATAYRNDHGLTWQQFGDKIGVNKTTLQLFCSNKYGADNRTLAWRVNRFFLAEAAAAEMALWSPLVPDFIMTETARSMTNQIRWAHRGEISVITGDPGVGKTATFNQYLVDTPNAFMVTADKATTGVGAILLALLHATGTQTRRGGHAYVLRQILLERLEHLNALIIIDEAQHLDDDAVEMLRAIHDALKCGLVLGGNRTVMSRVQKGARTPAFAQLHSRVSWPQHYARPTTSDIGAILGAWGITRPAEANYLRQIAAQAGGLRAITQTLKMATLAASAGDEERVLGHLEETYRQRVQPLLDAA